MNKWKTQNLNIDNRYEYHGKCYLYLAYLLGWEYCSDDIKFMRVWLYDNDIDAFEFEDDFTWAFLDESDRTAFLLTWS